MFKYLIQILLVCFGSSIYAQIPMEASINIFPPYPTQYNVWLSDAANYVITVSNNSDQTFDYYLRFGLEGESGGEETFVRASPMYFPSESLTLGPYQTTTLTSADLEFIYGDATINDLDRSPNIPIDLDGQLPEGSYQLCFTVMAYDRDQEIFLSPELCSDVFSVGHNTLELVYPPDETIWSETDLPITFQWLINGSQTLQTDYRYTLDLFQLDPLQVANESVYELVNEGGIAPFFSESDIDQQSFIYDENFGLPALTEGALYAAQVSVFDPTTGYFDNSNRSNINTFYYGYDPYAEDDGDSGASDITCQERCEVPPPSNTVLRQNLQNLTDFSIGNFTVQGLNIESDLSSQVLNGTGYVTLSFLNDVKLAVNINGVRLNTNDEAIEGVIIAKKQGEHATLLDQIGSNLAIAGVVDEGMISSLIDAVRNVEAIQQVVNQEVLALPFGLSQEIDESAFTFAMIDFEATVSGASMDFTNIVDLSSLAADAAIGIGATDVCVSPEGFGREFTINLLSDVNIPLDANMELTLAGGTYIDGADYSTGDLPMPCHFQMVCDGFKAMGISGSILFDEEEVVKEIDNEVQEGIAPRAFFSTFYETDLSNSSITGNIIPRSDFMAEVTMDDFQFVKLPGYTFKIENAVLDFSELSNAESMSFPASYAATERSELWTGLYISDLSMYGPKEILIDGERGYASISDILIDPLFSFDIVAEDLVPYPAGTFKDWSMGIDSVSLIVQQNTFISGAMSGKISPPVLAEDDALDYSFLLAEKIVDGDRSYSMDGLVQPSQNVNIPMAIAEANICNSSYLAFQFGKGAENKNAEIFFKGDLNLNTEFAQNVIGTAALRLADYQIHYNTTKGFIGSEEVTDGLGSYFGMHQNQAVNCSDASVYNLQNIFDRLTEEMIQQGEDIWRDVEETVTDGANSIANNTFDEDDYLNDFPIRFNRSSLTLVDGEPELNLIVQAQIDEENTVEAGIKLTSKKDQNSGNLRFRVDDVELYLSQGNVTLNAPFDGSDLAMNEDISVEWENTIEEAENETFQYRIAVLPKAEYTNFELDSLFRNEAVNFLFQLEDHDENTYNIPLTEIESNLTETEEYAIRVQAISSEGNTLFNDGYSNISFFTWGQVDDPGENAGNNGPCAERCSPDLPSGIAITPSSDLESFTIGNFNIVVEEIESVSGNQFSGIGYTQIDFLNNVKLNISFTNIEINASNQAIDGTVQGVAPNSTLISTITSVIDNAIDSESAFANLTGNTELISSIANIALGNNVNLPFALDLNFQDAGGESNNVRVAFSDFEITPTTSDIDLLLYMSMESLGDGFKMGLGAKDICIAPDGFGGELSLFLGEDLPINIDGESVVTFLGGSNPVTSGNESVEPCFVKLDCDGFKELNLAGIINFSDETFLKEDPTTGQLLDDGPVQGRFQVNFEVAGDAYAVNEDVSATNLLIAYTMDPFQLAELEGWGFEVADAVLDISETKNLATMEFPENFDQTNWPAPEFWTGFYMKELSLKPPADFSDGELNEERNSYAINNFLLDPTLSAKFTTGELLSFEDGNIEGWGFSIADFHLEVLQNNFVDGGMSGLLGAPVLAESDYLQYEAVIAMAEDNNSGDQIPVFNAIIRPQSAIGIPMLGGSATICESSYLGIQLGVGEGNRQAELFLKGSMGVKFSDKFSIELLDMQLKYNTVKGFVMEQDVSDGTGTTVGMGLSVNDACSEDPYEPDFDALRDEYFNAGGSDTERNITTADPDVSTGGSEDDSRQDPDDNSMNGFPFRLHNFGIDLVDGNPIIKFSVDVSFAGGSDGFAAGADLAIVTKKNQRLNGKTGIAFDRLRFGCARMAVDVDFMTLLGCLCYKNEDLGGGASNVGYGGRVIVNVMDEIMVDLQGSFSTYRKDSTYNTYNTLEYHANWYVAGKFASNTGIPMGPITFNAIGGGIYWNMEAPPPPGFDTNMESDGSGSSVAQDVNNCMQDLSDATGIIMPTGGEPLASSPRYDPPSDGDNGSYGKRTIKVNAGLSIFKPSLLIIDPEVSVSWTEGEGIDNISAGGYLYLLQQDYFSRGLGANGGSRLWIASNNSIVFDREDAKKTQVAFHGTGTVYMNMIPNVLYGNAPGGDPFRVISHDVMFANRSHNLLETRNIDTRSLNGNTYWHAYFGNPYTNLGPGQVTFDLAGAIGDDSATAPEEAGLQATFYAMAGHGIPSELPPIPDKILNILNTASAASNGENSGDFSGESTDNPDNREQLQDKTSGFALGSSVSLGISMDKIIQAELDVTIGMDLLFKNISGQGCETTSGGQISNPGVFDFYGEGQAYAGLIGSLSIGGKILGKSINTKFLDLSAAMMIRAGGPNPFYVRGRAGVNYSILGGKIEGSAYVEVSAGEQCSFYDYDPFSLEIINKISPDDTQVGTDAADPYSAVMVSFTTPVADEDNPELGMLEVPAIDNKGKVNMMRLAPILTNFQVLDTDGDIDGNVEWSNSRRTVRFLPSSPMNGSDVQGDLEAMRIGVSIRALEYDDDKGRWIPLSNYQKDTIVDFEAAALSPYEENVTHTNPIRGQRFFMPAMWLGPKRLAGSTQQHQQGKAGVIRFYADVRDDRFYSEKNGADCAYFVVWKDADTGEEVDRYELSQIDIVNTGSPRRTEIRYPISPFLQGDSKYVLQVVRKMTMNGTAVIMLSGSTITLGSGPNQQISRQQNAQDIEAEYQQYVEEDAEDTFRDVANDETLIHMVVFGTSEHASMEDKLAGVDVDAMLIGSTIPMMSYWNHELTNERLKVLPANERFEKAELTGSTETVSIQNYGTQHFYTDPRIMIIDPFEGDYYEDLRDKMNSVLSINRSNLDNRYVGLRRLVFGVDIGPVRFNYPQNDLAFINAYQYQVDGSNKYGNASILLDDYYYGGYSYMLSPYGQSSNSYNMQGSGGVTFIDQNNPLTGGGGYSNGGSVMINYPIREIVKLDTDHLIDWAHEHINATQYPVFPLYSQNWSWNSIRNKLRPIGDAMVPILETPGIYIGPYSAFNNTQLLNTFSSFRVDHEIDFYYNVEKVTEGGNREIRWYKEKKTVTVD